MESIKVLSLFDGISCGRVALDRLGLKVSKYTAYEIDENAIAVSKDNWKDIEHKGDVFDAKYEEGIYDLLIGGSPCFIAGTQVLTINGYKNIEDLEVGDLVYTHNDRYN